MGQIVLPNNIPPLLKTSGTTCTLAATHMNQATRIIIGGQQYKLSSQLTLNTATTGLGGLDTGTLGSSHQLYYVYACVNTSGVVGLVASLTGPASGPSGFSGRYTLVGAFYVQDTAVIGSTVTIDGEANSTWQTFTPTLAGGAVRATIHTELAYWRRRGVDLEYNYFYRQTANTGANSGSDVTGFGLPTSFATSSVLVVGVSIGNSSDIGVAQVSTTANFAGSVYARDTTNLSLFVTNETTSGAISNTFHGFASTATVQYTFKASVPISGWSKTLLG